MLITVSVAMVSSVVFCFFVRLYVPTYFLESTSSPTRDVKRATFISLEDGYQDIDDHVTKDSEKVIVHDDDSVTAGDDVPSGGALMPDILMIFADDLNADMLEPWANHTPGLYKLMDRNGTTTFYEAYTHVPKCAPGRMSVMTGISTQRSAQRGDCMTKYQALLDGPTVYTIPKLMKDHFGYTSVGTGKIFHQSPGAVARRKDWDVYWPSLDDGLPYFNMSCYQEDKSNNNPPNETYGYLTERDGDPMNR